MDEVLSTPLGAETVYRMVMVMVMAMAVVMVMVMEAIRMFLPLLVNMKQSEVITLRHKKLLSCGITLFGTISRAIENCRNRKHRDNCLQVANAMVMEMEMVMEMVTVMAYEYL